jgi:hypothetical protein
MKYQIKFLIFLQKTYEVYEYNDWNPLIFLPERAISVADFTGRKKKSLSLLTGLMIQKTQNDVLYMVMVALERQLSF